MPTKEAAKICRLFYHMQMYMYIFIYSQICVCMDAYNCITKKCVYIYIYVNRYVYMYVCIHICIHNYKCMCISRHRPEVGCHLLAKGPSRPRPSATGARPGGRPRPKRSLVRHGEAPWNFLWACSMGLCLLPKDLKYGP